MSMHMHMRAIAESEIRDDHTWLETFMLEAWENYADERKAGIAASIEKVWGPVNDLYAATAVLHGDADRSWELPIYGGRSAAHGAAAYPPLGILESPGVSQAAGFLARVSFEELWNVAGATLVWAGWDEAQARQDFLEYHRCLRGFYGRAAAAGHAVIRVVWA